MTTTKKTVRLNSVADLVGVIPQMFGFRVDDSVVLAAVAGGRLCGVVRFDRPEVVPTLTDPHTVDESIAQLVHRGATDVLLVAYGEASGESLAPMRAAVSAAPLGLLDYGRVEAGEWVSLVTGERAPIPADRADMPAPLESREALREALAPAGTAAAAAVLDVADPITPERVPAAVEALAALISGRVAPSPEALGTALPLLAEVAYRDALLMVLTEGSDPADATGVPASLGALMRETLPDLTEDTLDTLVTVCHATPPRHAAPVLTFAAVCHMAKGMNTHSRLLAEHALASDPSHSLAMLTMMAAERGMSLHDERATEAAQ